MNLETRLAEFRATYAAIQGEFARASWRYRRGRTAGEPVLWLTGALGLGDFAFGYARSLGEDFRLVIPDYPPLPTLDEIADGLAAILDAEGIPAAHVVGGSFGGMLAQYFVRRHPDRVRSLVLSHTAAPRPSYGRTAVIRIAARLLPAGPYRALVSRRLRGAFVNADPFWLRLFDTAVASLSKADLMSRVALAGQFMQLSYAPGDLTTWPGRILILEANDDPLIPAAARSALRALYPQAQVHTFSGTGHSAAILEPELYAGVIRGFLTSRTV